MNRVARLTTIVLLAAGCTAAHADSYEPQAIKQVPQRSQAAYQFELIDENGKRLETYRHGGRYYVLGMAAERYSIRVSNPTPRRVEAVISVDGLDVVDGRPAAVRKRGYIVPAYGEIKVDGFRTSSSQVAAFRFSSVRSSYAGRKGKARNVGVIGVAFFPERSRPSIAIPDQPIIHPHPRPRPRPRPYWRRHRDGNAHSGASKRKRPSRPADLDSDDRAQADEAPAPSGGVGGQVAPPPPRTRTARPQHRRIRPRPEYKPRVRPGLGTMYGEQRHSAIQYTKFVRASAHRPAARAELRYNNSSGLRAMGIVIRNHRDPYDSQVRHTADPFPADHGRRRFANPPPSF